MTQQSRSSGYHWKALKLLQDSQDQPLRMLLMLHNEQLRQVGIFYRGSDVERQFLYVMGDMENDTRTHHIHIVKWNGTEWKNYIHFRDYLNDNENMALQYQKVKEELESKYADDRVAYTNGKQDMIDLILDNQ